MYATLEDYQNWLMGRSPTIPLIEFEFWSNQASIIVDSVTSNRLQCDEIFEEYYDNVINAVCALAELLFTDKTQGKRQSWSIGSFSENFGTVDKDQLPNDIRKVINQNLANTGLLFRG